jgi:biopolymer transport protein ExbD
MGGVSVESKGGGRKSVDTQVNMVPMIDLLISVIAFLLMTAVWVQTGALQALQPRGAPSQDTPPDQQQDQLKIQITESGLHVGITQTDNRDIANGPQMLDELRRLLHERHTANQQQHEVWLQPDSTVHYNAIIEVMDIVYEIWGEGRAPNAPIRDSVTIRFL